MAYPSDAHLLTKFHLLGVACIFKSNVGKDREIGRFDQFEWIGGNVLMVLPATSVRQKKQTIFDSHAQGTLSHFWQRCTEVNGNRQGLFHKGEH